MNTLRSTFAAIVFAVVGIACNAANAAKIEVAGDLTMVVELKNSPVSALAIGAGAKAHAAVNEISGSVKAGGKVEMKANLSNSPVSALAIGPMAKAVARVNAVVGE